VTTLPMPGCLRAATPRAQTCETRPATVSPVPMTRIFDLDDHARLPWRFFGAMLTVLARP